MKSLLRLLAERVLPTSLTLEINKRERPHIKGKNMYKIIKSSEDITEFIDNVNIGKNIILCSRENETLIRQNIDGTFSLILNRDENLSMGKTTQDGRMSVIEYKPMIKMCIPQGIKIDIGDPPFGFPYFSKTYSECKTFYPDNKEKDSTATGFIELPANYYLIDFTFIFHIDIQRLRQASKTFLVKKGQSVCNIAFLNLLHLSQAIDNVIYVKNTEVFHTFLDVF